MRLIYIVPRPFFNLFDRITIYVLLERTERELVPKVDVRR